MGDFNYPEVNWGTLRSDNKGSREGAKFVKISTRLLPETATRMDNIY